MATKIIAWAVVSAIPIGVVLAIMFHPAWLFLSLVGAALLMAGG